MRIFLAAEVNEGIRVALSALQGELRERGIRDARWIDPEQIHLTLRFCGEASEDQLERLILRLSAGPPLSPFSVSLGSLGLFPVRGTPRILHWRVADQEGRLARLAAWLETEVTAVGFLPERRAFQPHLTVARFLPGARRPAEALIRAGSCEGGALTVDRVVLFRSHLRSSGARYEMLRVFPLASGAASGACA